MVRGDSQLATPRKPMYRLAKELVYPPFLRMFDAGLYVGARNRSYYRHYSYPTKRLFHSPHCVDTERFKKNASEEIGLRNRAKHSLCAEDVVIMFAGRLVDFKRPLDVVKIAKAVREHGLEAKIAVAGSGPMENEMNALAESQGVPIRHLGFQNQSEMPAAYAMADILVLPSTAQETWGLVCNEAIATNTPVVVSDAAGCAPDLTASELVGRSFPVGNISVAAAQVKDLVMNPPRQAHFDSVNEAFSLRAGAEGVLEAIEHLSASTYNLMQW